MSLRSSWVSKGAGTVILQQHKEFLCSHLAVSIRSRSHNYCCRSPLLTAWLRWQHGRASRSNTGSLLHSAISTAACLAVAAAGAPAEGTLHEGQLSRMFSSAGTNLPPGGAAHVVAAVGVAVELRKRGRPPKRSPSQLPGMAKAALAMEHKHRGRMPKQVRKQQEAGVEVPSVAAGGQLCQQSALDNNAVIKRRGRSPQQQSAVAAAAGTAGMHRVTLQRRPRRARSFSATMQADDEQEAILLPTGLPATDEGITGSPVDATAADTSASSSSADGGNSADGRIQQVRHIRRTAKRSVLVAVSPAIAGVEEVPAAETASAAVATTQECMAEGQQQQLVEHDQPTPPCPECEQQLQQQQQQATHAEVSGSGSAGVDWAVWEGSEDSYTLGGSAASEPNRDSLWDVSADRVNIVQRLEQALNIPPAPCSAVHSVLGSAGPPDMGSSGGGSGVAGAQIQHGTSLNGSSKSQQLQRTAAPNGFQVSTTISGHRYNGQTPLGFSAFRMPNMHEQQHQVPEVSVGDARASANPQGDSSSGNSFSLRPGRAPLESSPIEPTPPEPPALVHPELAEASQLVAQRTQQTQHLLEQIQQMESVAQAKLSSPEMQALLVVARLSDDPAVAKWLQADPQVLRDALGQLSLLQASMQQLSNQRQQLEAKLAASRQQPITSGSSSSSSSSCSSCSIAAPQHRNRGTGNVTGAADHAGGAASSAAVIGAAAAGEAMIDDSPAAAAAHASSADNAAASLDVLQSILPELEAVAGQREQEADR